MKIMSLSWSKHQLLYNILQYVLLCNIMYYIYGIVFYIVSYIVCSCALGSSLQRRPHIDIRNAGG
jgi:hypothetical protein